jgi:hypothetical protein
MWGVQKENEPLPETSKMDVTIELERWHISTWISTPEEKKENLERMIIKCANEIPRRLRDKNTSLSH